jgi:hypothetical protein
MTTAATARWSRLNPPYITPYAEQVRDLPLTFEPTPEGPRLTYRDATPQDWRLGVLWARFGTARGETPLFNMVHPLYQRRCMLRRLCRVCGRSAVDPETGRIWWITPTELLAGAGICSTGHPPTCKAHIAEALTACPHLRQGSPGVYTVGRYEVIGVLANLYADVNGRVVETDHQTGVGVDEPHLLRRALSTQVSVLLYDIQPAPLP